MRNASLPGLVGSTLAEFTASGQRTCPSWHSDQQPFQRHRPYTSTNCPAPHETPCQAPGVPEISGPLYPPLCYRLPHLHKPGEAKKEIHSTPSAVRVLLLIRAAPAREIRGGRVGPPAMRTHHRLRGWGMTCHSSLFLEQSFHSKDTTGGRGGRELKGVQGSEGKAFLSLGKSGQHL